MWTKMLEELEALEERLADAPEETSDVRALVRIELANILRRAAVLLRALAQGEGTTGGEKNQ
jgi:hypothetical protein